MPERIELELRARVGRRIREEAERQGLTMQRLADMAGINLSHLSRALNGDQSMTLDRLAKVAATLEVDPSELLRPDA